MRALVVAVVFGSLLMAQENTPKQQLQPRYAEAIRAFIAGRLTECT
jgi:hypothetical protein